MKNRVTLKLGAGRIAVLSSLAVAALAGPVFLGILRASPVPSRAAQPQIARNPAQSALTFEVASIRLRPDAGGGGRGGGPAPEGLVPACGGLVDMDPTFVRFRGYTLYQLVTEAYGGDCALWERLEGAPLSGGPAWIRSDRYDIEAVIPEAPVEFVTAVRGNVAVVEDIGPRVRTMLRNLLADRFGLVLDAETRELPAYFLTAGAGYRLEPAEEAYFAPLSDDPDVRSGQLEQELASWREMRAAGYDRLAMMGSVGDLSRRLALLLGRPVVDRTAVAGQDYGWLIEYDESGVVRPTIPDALEERYGLHLETATAPMEVLVIEQVARPSEN